MAEHKIDEVSGTETTGHEWDGIAELNTPLPKWWLNVFYATIIFSIGYYVINPSWPYFNGQEWTYAEGVGDYDQRDVVGRQLAEARAELSDELAAMREASVEEILADENLRRIANQAGESHFGDNCAGCHGSGAQGFTGFPNLRDDNWLWGGELEEIKYTIEHGIRWDEDYETRLNVMPAYLKDEILSEQEVRQAVNYVLQLSGQPHDAGKAEAGSVIFAEQCSVCHGDNGKGVHELGAPNLTDAIWLYGGDADTIYETVAYSRYGVMPAWSGRLDPLTIKQLTLYVHLLGGGETQIAGNGTGPEVAEVVK